LKFIVDAQLPRSLSDLFKELGYDCIHTLDLPGKNQTTDREINHIAQKDSRTVISKDNDFLLSYIIKKIPPKLVIVSTGNLSNADLLKLFKSNIEKIKRLLKSNHVIEINRTNIIVHY